MKRFVFCLLLLALLLSACSANTVGPVYTVEHSGMTFTVDAQQWTITQGEDVYKVQYDHNGSSWDINITYPNGAEYWWRETANGGVGGYDTNYDPQRYVSGDVLMEVLEREIQPASEKSTGSLLLGVICILLGAFNLFLPELAWRVQYGWAYKNVEPTNIAILLNRITGAMAAFLGVILVFF